MPHLDSTPSLTAKPPIWAIPLALGLLVFLLLGLGQPPLFDVDEGAFSEATRGLLSSGDWGHTTLNGLDRFDKPIGVYWLQALSGVLLGPTELAMRLPSALATWLSALALWRFVAGQWGLRTGAWAAIIHVTSFGSWAMAHAATADAVLGMFLMLSAIDLWRYLQTEDMKALRRLALWVGAGLLVKGPVALLIPAASLLIHCLVSGQWAVCRKALLDVRAWLYMLAMALPWYAYAVWRHGENFVQGFILKHNVERFTAPMEGHDGHWLYFVIVAPILWMPWTPLLLAWWGRWQALWGHALTRQALIWTVFVLVFFSFSGTKLPHYGIYAAPGVVLLLTVALERMQTWHAVLCAVVLLAWQALLVGLPWFWMTFPEQVPQALMPIFRHGLDTLPLVTIATLWGLLALTLLICRARMPRLGMAETLSAMAVVHGTVLALVVWPWWANALQGPIKALGLEARNWPSTVGQIGGNWPSFAFYRQQALLPKGHPASLYLAPESQVPPGARVWAKNKGMVLFQTETASRP